MTAVIAWLNKEDGDAIWVAADSRLTKKISNESSLIVTDAAVKIFSLPVIIKKPDERGFYNDLYHNQKIGFCYSGSSIVALNTYASLTSLLSGLVGFPNEPIPSMYDYALVISRVLKKSIQSAGENLGTLDSSNSVFVNALVLGYCFKEQTLKLYSLRPNFNGGDLDIEVVESLLEEGKGIIIGDKNTEISNKIEELRSTSSPKDIKWQRMPQYVLSFLIKNKVFPSIGGNLQVGIAHKPDFELYGIAVPIEEGKPEATLKYLNLDFFDDLGMVGECRFAATSLHPLAGKDLES